MTTENNTPQHHQSSPVKIGETYYYCPYFLNKRRQTATAPIAIPVEVTETVNHYGNVKYKCMTIGGDTLYLTSRSLLSREEAAAQYVLQ